MTDSSAATINVSFIGFGEAAMAITNGWREDENLLSDDCQIQAYDCKTDSQLTRDAKLADMAACDVIGCESVDTALTNCHAVFSLVTADQATDAAKAAAQVIKPETLYFDGNSCSPGTKQHNAQLIEGAGAHYFDLAIMSPVYPQRHQTPMLVSGNQIELASALLNSLRMNATSNGTQVGQSSAIKMIRSVMVKGMEALTAECVLAARKAGVDETVLDSLQHTFPDTAWRQRSAYNLERMMLHGERRAQEMREVAATLQELGLYNGMALACSQWQSSIGSLKLTATDNDYGPLADNVLSQLEQQASS
ncbi:NAD(P)-dependent oxidoreductase [Aurantivibrio plasticivorans]